ncbi:maleylpyruvate isomerase family mycothiol-dependent enzyme [Skermania piniformis]|uniref:maleylpyruvate isomerase family mycothiol-dependent enzyme n=1 Tax=Skermania pinensis TaxID=39122 RepID=UPI0039E7D417
MTGPDAWLAAIRTEGAALAATPTDSLDAAVPSCPGWTVHDLIAHVGAVHRWATTKILRTDGPRGIRADQAPPGTAVSDWYQESLDGLVAAFAHTTPDTPAPTFVAERDVAFWLRRQAHELAVHRWDADSAVRPGDERPIAAVLAADGIDEWLGLFVPRFLAEPGAVPDNLVGRTLHLHATDYPDGEWLLTVARDGVTYTRAHAEGDAAVRATTSDLLLTVWRRRGLGEVEVFGDRTAAAAILDLVQVS